MVVLGFNTPSVNSQKSGEGLEDRLFHHRLSIQAGAYQNSTWVVAVAKAGSEDGHPLMGGTLIADPDGKNRRRTAGRGRRRAGAPLRPRRHALRQGDDLRFRPPPPARALPAHRRAHRGRPEARLLMRVVDPAAIAPDRVYKILCGLVVPRPIALVTTMDAAGVVNAAPFSFFNVFSEAPPLVVLGLQHRPAADGFARKDTTRNIATANEFVVNMVGEDIAEAMNICAVDFPPGVSELAEAGLTTAPSAMVAPPRIAESPAALECRKTVSLTFGPGRELLVGEIVAIQAHEDVMSEAFDVDMAAYRPVGRLFGTLYSRQHDIFALARESFAERGGGQSGGADPAPPPPSPSRLRRVGRGSRALSDKRRALHLSLPRSRSDRGGMSERSGGQGGGLAPAPHALNTAAPCPRGGSRPPPCSPSRARWSSARRRPAPA